jgi:hypothetical protein
MYIYTVFLFNMQPAIRLVDKSLYDMYEYIVADVAAVPVALE